MKAHDKQEAKSEPSKAIAFFDAVNNHPDLRGVGINHIGFLVEHKPTKIYTMFPFDVVEKEDVKDLIEVATVEREPRVLHTFARVCGYYSRVNNWNKSKVGELHDRHKGEYKVE